jgi:hypothetical protein
MRIVVRFPRRRKSAERIAAPPVMPPDMVQDDWGNWWVGLHDNAVGAFPTMQCAAAVSMTHHQPIWWPE